MIQQLAKDLVSIKQEFYRVYKGNSHVQEFLPAFTSEVFPINENHLKKLIKFAEANPIYYNSFELELSGVSCIVYEGDINNYWINSLKHDSSYQPFYPTWILSAYLLAMESKNLGYEKLIDIGSGDGRIAYCGRVVDSSSYSIEIDESLVDLQNQIQSEVSLNFNPICYDAIEFDYLSLNLSNSEFFIGGLPQQGEMLANNILSKIYQTSFRKESGFVLAGSNSNKHFSGNFSNGGWGQLIEKFHLHVEKILTIPTSWTFDQQIDTPYYFTKF